MADIDKQVSSERGVTLIELLVALSILAILLAVGVPALSQFSVNSRLSHYANSIFSDLALARSEAIKRNRRVVLCKSSDGLTCTNTGDWSQGWIVFADPDNDGNRDGGDLIIHKMPASAPGYRLMGNSQIDNYVSYDSQGMTRLVSGAFQAGTFTLCPPAPAAAGAGREVILSSSGRARVVKIASCS